ncbi:hypothetical protein RCF27_07200 [Rhodococcus pyridinivorans]|uniref:Uncharacterized protein n=1 Tax=Rhodococcus pyridinivorans TaxID=103816 RepID=A0A7M2XTB3_9NOCA|nr:hypothetical protein [Rhodococcus pyridinivorans]QOW00181.1 hypothetical protein INP59_07495 [Rhodococcus pyridinivorans]WMM74082.1 hypothetical protein RCF27_07200 [Rhodococcus pyridinivorans]
MQFDHLRWESAKDPFDVAPFGCACVDAGREGSERVGCGVGFGEPAHQCFVDVYPRIPVTVAHLVGTDAAGVDGLSGVLDPSDGCFQMEGDISHTASAQGSSPTT